MTEHTDFNGKWQVYKSENFEDFLAANGANWFVRKMAGMAKPVVEIHQEGDKVTIKMSSVMMSREESFTIGEQYEQIQHSGDKTKALASWDDDKLVITYDPIEGDHPKPQKIIREIKDGELIMTMMIENVEAKRYMKKVE